MQLFLLSILREFNGQFYICACAFVHIHEWILKCSQSVWVHLVLSHSLVSVTSKCCTCIAWEDIYASCSSCSPNWPLEHSNSFLHVFHSTPNLPLPLSLLCPHCSSSLQPFLPCRPSLSSSSFLPSRSLCSLPRCLPVCMFACVSYALQCVRACLSPCMFSVSLCVCVQGEQLFPLSSFVFCSSRAR